MTQMPMYETVKHLVWVLQGDGASAVAPSATVAPASEVCKTS